MPNEVEITITAHDLSGPAFDSALARMIRLREEAAALRKEMGDATHLKMDSNDITSSLISLKSKMQSLGIADIADVNVQPGRLATQLNLLKRLIQQAGISDILDVNINSTSIADAIHKISSVSETIPVKFDVAHMPTLGPTSNLSEHISFDINPGAVDALNGKLRIMDREAMNVAYAVKDIRKGFDGIGLSPATIAAMNAAVSDSRRFGAGLGDIGTILSGLRTRMSDFVSGLLGISNGAHAATSSTAGLAQAFAGLNAHAGPVANNLSLINKAQQESAVRSVRAFGAWKALNVQIPLFGGALKQLFPNMGTLMTHLTAVTNGWHLAAEAIIETAGTLIPAAIAFGVFAAAATPTVMDLGKQMQNTYTVTQAFQKSLYPLSGGFQQVANAVQPQVYVLFGEGLVEAAHQTGLFQTIATQTGKVLNDLGARFVYATTQSGTFGTIAKHAAGDLNIWGTGIGNLGGILGNIMKVLPGYAELIGQAFDGATHAIESFTASGIVQGIMKIGLAAHGALFWIGLLGTGASFLVTKGLGGIASMASTAAGGLAKLGPVGEMAAARMTAFSGAAQKAAALPWNWIMIAAAALGYLVYSMASAKDSAEQMTAGIQKGLENLPLNELQPGLTVALGSANASLKALSGTMAGNTVDMSNFHLGMIHANSVAGEFATKSDLIAKSSSNISGIAGLWVRFSHAVGLVKTPVEDAQAAVSQFSQDQATVNDHMAQASKAFGGTAKAMAIMTGAGITSNQMLDRSKQAWAEAMIEAQAYADALKATALNAGQMGAAQNALNYAAGTSVNKLGEIDSAMTKATQAQDQLIQALTGGSSALDAFMQYLGSTAKAAHVAGASMGGTTAASYQLNGAFYQTVTQAQKVVDALEMQNASTRQVTTASATLGGQMLKYAGHNEAARVAVVDLINNALGPGTVSLQNLDGWIKKNGTSLSGLNAIIAQSRINASHLANVLQQDLNAQFQAALLKSSGATNAIKAYAQAVTHGGTATAAAHGARAQLIADLEKTGMDATTAKGYADQLLRSISSLHGKNIPIATPGIGAVITSVNQLGDAIRNLPSTKYINIIENHKVYTISAGGAASPHATGGPAAGGGGRSNLTLVGEHGPELVRLPPSSWVYSNSDSQRMASPGWGDGGSGRPAMQLEISSSGHSAFEQFMLMAIRNWVRVKGGGNVQKAFGR